MVGACSFPPPTLAMYHLLLPPVRLSLHTGVCCLEDWSRFSWALCGLQGLCVLLCGKKKIPSSSAVGRNPCERRLGGSWPTPRYWTVQAIEHNGQQRDLWTVRLLCLSRHSQGCTGGDLNSPSASPNVCVKWVGAPKCVWRRASLLISTGRFRFFPP